jgi:hypothetical protein
MNSNAEIQRYLCFTCVVSYDEAFSILLYPHISIHPVFFSTQSTLLMYHPFFGLAA